MTELTKIFNDYKREIVQINTHTGKFLRISKFLNDIFGLNLVDVAFGAEKYLKSKVHAVKGRSDLIFGGIVLEIKLSLTKELNDAVEELERYLIALKDLRKGENFIGIVTDGIEFRAYVLTLAEKLKEISKTSVYEGAETLVFWLDSYFFTKKDLKPTAEDLQIKFGLRSPTYSILHEVFLDLFNKVANKSYNSLKFELWKKHLEIVYGSAPDLEEFIDHTYLVTLVKLIMYLRLHRKVEWKEIENVLNGSFFKEVGITNFIEEDFFSWILDEEIKNNVIENIKKLLVELDVYNFEEADEDLFKEIYQDIIGPQARHRIGEYYTPEWLAQLIVIESMKYLKNKNIPRILDPACGSGTFITNSIHYFIEELKGIRESKLLETILTNIIGIDINPLAVIIAKANYIIALGDLVRIKKAPLSIPIYLADSIKLPQLKRTLHANVNSYEVTIGNGKEKRQLFIPEEIATNETLLSTMLSRIADFLIAYKLKSLDRRSSQKIFDKSLTHMSSSSISILKHTFQTLLQLVDEGRDTIWVFILRNFYAPLRFSKEKFDIIVGNPPWIAFRYVENKEYQEDLKRMIFDYGLLSSDEIHLFTQMEVATLFYRRCADLYLKNGGVISFVMPRSVITGAKHHQKFKEFTKPTLKLTKIFDLEFDTQFKVRPLFNVPSCVLLSINDGKTKYPIPVIAYSATLPKKNAKFVEISSLLNTREYEYSPPKVAKEKSYYYDLFKAGAAVYPRPLWFIDFEIDPKFGIDPLKPRVISSKDSIKDAKGNWKKVMIKGNVEKDFIYVTLLSKDIKPFGYDEVRPIILPVKTSKNNLVLLSSENLRKQGVLGIADWIEKCQNEWNKSATSKDKKNFPKVEMSINHLQLLTSQDLGKKWIVLSATSGTHTMACVIDREKFSKITMNGNSIKSNGFVCEKTTFFYGTNNEDEAYYLAAVINSNYIDEAIKSFQAKGSFGARHIQRIPFELPIPKFDSKNSKHRRLAELGKTCTNKVKSIIQTTRLKIKEDLSKYIEEIDQIVKEII